MTQICRFCWKDHVVVIKAQKQMKRGKITQYVDLGLFVAQPLQSV